MEHTKITYNFQDLYFYLFHLQTNLRYHSRKIPHLYTLFYQDTVTGLVLQRYLWKKLAIALNGQISTTLSRL